MNTEPMITIWKCSEDPNKVTPELTGQVSKNHYTVLLCRWANGKVGAIFPVYDNQILCFSAVKPGSRNSPELEFIPTHKMEADNSDIDSHIISYGGIVARWLLDSCGLHPIKTGLEILNDHNFRKNILYAVREEPHLELLYESHLEATRIAARNAFELQHNVPPTHPGAWKPENKREFEFSFEEHLKEERRMKEYDEQYLYPFFSHEDIKFMRAIAQDYQEYIQYKYVSSSVSQDGEKKKTKVEKPKEKEKIFVPIQDTFEIENTTEERLQKVFQFCIDRKWLDDSTRVDDWLKLFAGVPSDVRMIWDNESRHALRDLFWVMDREKDAEEKTFLKARRNYLHIVSSHFISEKPSQNNPKPYITDFSGRNNQKQYKQAIDFCRRILRGEDYDKIIFDMLEAQNKAEVQTDGSMHNDGMPENISVNKSNIALQQGLRTPKKTIRQTKIK